MLKLILWAAAGLIVAAGIVLVYAATLPNEFRVSRSLSINAPREKNFPLIADLKAFDLWNPFAKQDPKMTITYSGPATGKGAADAWDSGGRAGKGSLEITDTVPLSSVSMALNILKPLEGHNIVVFSLQASGDETVVSWTMTGQYVYVAKVMSLVFNMDKMIGGEFEKGLADLKSLAEQH